MIQNYPLKIQVKGTSQLEKRSRNNYSFSLANGKGDQYRHDDFDIAALVALPEERVIFTTKKKVAHRIPAGHFTPELEISSWQKCLKQAIDRRL